jgi:hypothetical protein
VLPALPGAAARLLVHMQVALTAALAEGWVPVASLHHSCDCTLQTGTSCILDGMHCSTLVDLNTALGAHLQEVGEQRDGVHSAQELVGDGEGKHRHTHIQEECACSWSTG